MTIVVIPDSTGDLTNTATVNSSVADPSTGDNTVTETTTAIPSADLSVTKDDTPDPVLLGEELTYTVTIINSGPSDATDVVLTDTLPAAASFVSASAGCGEAGGAVTCTIGTIASGDTATVSITVAPTEVSTITNTATASSAVADPSTGDNTATETTTVNPAADLSVTKADSPDPALLGEELTYALTVTNAGPSYDTLVSLTDTLPGRSQLRLLHAQPRYLQWHKHCKLHAWYPGQWRHRHGDHRGDPRLNRRPEQHGQRKQRRSGPEYRGQHGHRDYYRDSGRRSISDERRLTGPGIVR